MEPGEGVELLGRGDRGCGGCRGGALAHVGHTSLPGLVDGLLNHLRVRDVAVPRLAVGSRRLDEQVTGAEHPLDDPLVECDVVDDLQRDLLPVLGDQARPVDHALVCDDVSGRPPPGELGYHDDEPGHQEGGDHPALPGEREVDRDPQNEDANQDRQQPFLDDLQPVGLELGDDLLTGTQEFRRISHALRVPIGSRPRGGELGGKREGPEGASAEASTLSGLSTRAVSGRGPNSTREFRRGRSLDVRSLDSPRSEDRRDPVIALPVSREDADPKIRRPIDRPTIPKDPRSARRPNPEPSVSRWLRAPVLRGFFPVRLSPSRTHCPGRRQVSPLA